jgi:serine/threonine protein phosphatase PrpC
VVVDCVYMAQLPVTSASCPNDFLFPGDHQCFADLFYHFLQEDAHIAILNFDGRSDRALFGVFDGHSGAGVARFCAKYFPDLLLASEHYKAGKFEEAFNTVYLKMDEMLLRPEHAQELRELGAEKSTSVHDDEPVVPQMQSGCFSTPMSA